MTYSATLTNVPVTTSSAMPAWVVPGASEVKALT